MQSLIFVYNAKSGIMHALFDVGHKIINPKTYPCSLCALTYDTFSENKTWKAFRKSSRIPMVFYHIDEFESLFRNTTFNYPVILAETNDKLELVVTREELDTMPTLDALINHLKSILNP